MVGTEVAGFCTPNRRDELGPLPADVAAALTPCSALGPRAALEATIAIASVLLIIVPHRRAVAESPGMGALMRVARARGVPFQVADPTIDPERLFAWLETIAPTSDAIRCLVTGPRATRWSDGERVALRLVMGMLTANMDCGELVIPADRRVAAP